MHKLISALAVFGICCVLCLGQEQPKQQFEQAKIAPAESAVVSVKENPLAKQKAFSFAASKESYRPEFSWQQNQFGFRQEIGTVKVGKGFFLSFERQVNHFALLGDSTRILRQDPARYRARLLFNAGRMQLSPRFSLQRDRYNGIVRMKAGIRIFF